MKIAISLDGTIADLNHRCRLYEKLLHATIDDPFKTPKLIGDESFWAGMKLYGDFSKCISDERFFDHDIYVLAQRPAKLYNISLAWLDRKGLSISGDNLIMQAIPRYDCRLLDIDLYVSANLAECATFVYDKTQAVFLNRMNQQDKYTQDIDRFKVEVPSHVEEVTWPEDIFSIINTKESPWK